MRVCVCMCADARVAWGVFEVGDSGYFEDRGFGLEYVCVCTSEFSFSTLY